MPDDSQGFTGESYDNSGELGANRWRHVAFIEQKLPVGVEGGAPGRPRRRRRRGRTWSSRGSIPTPTRTASAG